MPHDDYKTTSSTLLKSEDEMSRFAEKLSQVCPSRITIYLEGDLGTGKTTFVRCFLKALGFKERVKSPTFTLLETYQVANKTIYHFDLYRLKDPEELEYIGIRDFDEEAICFVEWAEKGEAHLPLADLICKLAIVDQDARQLEIVANSDLGKALVEKLNR